MNTEIPEANECLPKSRFGRRLVAAFAAGGLLLGACSSDSSTTEAATSDTTAATTASAVDDTDEMAEDEMTEDEMAEDEMTDDEMTEPTGVACSTVPADGEGSFAGMADDTAATAASNNPLLSTLVTAVTEADLVDTLNSDGPFTIFAPTNDAFAAIPEADLAAILADKDMLTSILTFHVVAGEKMSAADLIEAGSATTVNGAELTFAADGDALFINGSASSLCMDVPTANATVHIIDQVLVP